MMIEKYMFIENQNLLNVIKSIKKQRVKLKINFAIYLLIHITVELLMHRCTIASMLTCLFISTLIMVSVIKIKRLEKDNNLNQI